MDPSDEEIFNSVTSRLYIRDIFKKKKKDCYKISMNSSDSDFHLSDERVDSDDSETEILNKKRKRKKTSNYPSAKRSKDARMHQKSVVEADSNTDRLEANTPSTSAQVVDENIHEQNNSTPITETAADDAPKAKKQRIQQSKSEISEYFKN